MKGSELREWLSLTWYDLPGWISGALLVLMLFSGGGVAGAAAAAGAIVMAGVGTAIGLRRKHHDNPSHERFHRLAYPCFVVLVIGGVTYYYTAPKRPRVDRVDPSATPSLIGSPENRCSIKFWPPYNNPATETQKVGANTLTTMIASGDYGVFSLGVVTYPEGFFKSAPPPGWLQETFFPTVRTLEGTIERQEEYLYDGHPALRSIVDHPGHKGQQGYSRFELILVPPRLYTIRASHTDRAMLDSPPFKAFVDSFKLTTAAGP